MNIHHSIQLKDAKKTEQHKGVRFCSMGLCVLCGFAFIVPCAVSAQTAREMFNPPAKEYILGNNAVASNLVNQALSKFPTDEKLKKLKELIEQQQQDQQNQDQQNQNQQNQDQQNQDQQNQDPKNQDQQNQQNQDKQQQNQEKQKNQPAQPRQAGEMSKEEAQQLLDAMKQDEQDQRANLKPYLGQPVRVDKDW